jgi:hypothetical protein
VGLLDATELRPPSRIRRYAIIVVAVIATYAAFAGVLPRFFWYPIYYYSELHATHKFMNAVAAGDVQRAYGMWNASPSFSLKDFSDDWGPDGYYGPVKSFNVKDIYRPPNGSTGLVVIVEVSPYQQFPEKDDAVKQNKTKEVHLWIQLKDRTIEYPPPQYSEVRREMFYSASIRASSTNITGMSSRTG